MSSKLLPDSIEFNVDFDNNGRILPAKVSMRIDLSGEEFLNEIFSQLSRVHSLPQDFFKYHRPRLFNGTYIFGAAAVTPGSTLYQDEPYKLTKVCGSHWDQKNLEELGFSHAKSVRDIKSFLNLLGVSENVHRSDRHLRVAEELDHLSPELLSSLRRGIIPTDLHPITKAVHMAFLHYLNVSTETKFISLLLNKTGFDEEMLLVVSKFGLKIVYNKHRPMGAETVDDVPDICVIDVLSGRVLLVVTVEKGEVAKDYLPQTVANCIAAYCTNLPKNDPEAQAAKKQRLDASAESVVLSRVFCLHVTSTRFDFYVCEISSSLATALDTGTLCHDDNELYKLDLFQSIDFLERDSRKLILEILCKLQCHVAELARNSSASSV